MCILQLSFVCNNFIRKYKFWIVTFLILFSQLLYWFWIRNYTLAYFDTTQTNATTWFSDWVENLYPRLKTEKYRFDASFFIKKSDQIAIRFLFVSSLLSLLLIPTFYQILKAFFIKNSVYSEKITEKKQKFLIIYFLISNILLSNEWLEILQEYHQIATLYEPISFYKFISPSFPSFSFLENTFIFFKVVTIIGIGLCFAFVGVLTHRPSQNTKKIIKFSLLCCLILSSVLFIYLQGFLYGFGKIEHTYATWNWVCILFPFWIYKTSSNLNLISQNYLLFLAVGLVYTSSGLEKLFIGGVDWINGNALVSYLQHSPTDLGQKLANYPFLVTIFSLLTIFWEIGFLFILHKNKAIRLTLIFIGICFHVGVYFLLNVGHYFSPWIWVYIFLLPSQANKRFTQK